jgi:hypothetical protein
VGAGGRALRPALPSSRSAQSARKAIEAGRTQLDWKRCKADGPGATRLPDCRKLYVPLATSGTSLAPYGFVFQLIQKPDETLAWTMIAFGERHPADERTRNVYERAHKRLHGRYPQQRLRVRPLPHA